MVGEGGKLLGEDVVGGVCVEGGRGFIVLGLVLAPSVFISVAAATPRTNTFLVRGSNKVILIVWVSVCYKFYRCSGTKPIAFVAVDKVRARPLVQTAVRNAFGKLSASFIFELLIYLQCAGVRLTTLLEMLLQAIHHIIPALEISDELIETILMKRQVNMEPSDEEVDLTTEFMLDAFSVADQEALQKEIQTCKAHTEEWTSFKRAFKIYKVAFIFVF